VVRLEGIAPLASEFVLVRLLKISGADLNIFDFDHDLTWVGFFVDADGKVYGRYGGRDADGPDKRISLAGLRHAMQAALEAHRREPAVKPPPPLREKPLLAEDYPAARRRSKPECIHCHQIYEFRRADRRSAGTWKREEIWVYPLPENVGLTLEVDRGNHVRAVGADSPAARAGLRAGDVVRNVNGIPVASQADFRYGLHRGPWKGTLPIRWERDGKEMSASLELPEGWKKTNITWRPSMLDILPSLTVYGEDLSEEEKKKAGLGLRQLAFRQDKTVHAEAKAVGVRGGDIILGVEGQTLEMTMEEFLGHVRRNYLVGDSLTLLVLRDGKRVRLPWTLK
jgi:hypothetical protein